MVTPTKRQEYILNGGNPTGEDPAEVVAKNGYAGYPVGTSQTQTIMASLIILVGTARPTVSLNTRVTALVVPLRTSCW